MTTTNFCRIGSVLSLAFVFGGTAANAQVGAAAPSGQVGSPAANASRGDLSQPDDDGADSSDLNAKKTPPAPRTRLPAFNRVTSSRSEIVRGQSGGTASGAATESRASELRPYSSSANARAKTAKSGTPAGSTARQEPKKSVRPPAPAVRSVTHNYYPTLRPGLHVNGNQAQVARAAKGKNASQAGMGMGLGMGMSGSSGAHTARVGASATRAGGGSAMQSSPRR